MTVKNWLWVLPEYQRQSPCIQRDRPRNRQAVPTLRTDGRFKPLPPRRRDSAVCRWPLLCLGLLQLLQKQASKVGRKIKRRKLAMTVLLQQCLYRLGGGDKLHRPPGKQTRCHRLLQQDACIAMALIQQNTLVGSLHGAGFAFQALKKITITRKQHTTNGLLLVIASRLRQDGAHRGVDGPGWNIRV